MMFTKKQIWRLLIPLMLEQVLSALMGTADTMMVSNAGSAAISAVSLVDAINILLINVFAAMAAGGTIVCAQYLGRGEPEEARETGGQLIIAVTALSVSIMILFIVLHKPILRLVFGSVEAAVMENAEIYMLITVLSYPFIALYNAGAALFRVDGNSRLPLMVSMGSNVVNIAGNAVLIFGFRMGAAGAATATLASRIISAVIILICLSRSGRNIYVSNYLKLRPDFSRIRRILSVGVPTGIENGMFQFGKLAIQSTVSILGTTAIAAQAMTSTLENVISFAQFGIGLGLMTIAGQCIGAGRREEAKQHIVRLTVYSEITTVISCIIMVLIVGPVTRIGGMEPAAAQLTVHMCRYIAVVKSIVWSCAFTPVNGMRAAGDTRFSMVFSSISMWFCRVLVSIVLMRVFHSGPMGVWIGMFTDWTVRAIVFAIRFRSKKWLRHDVLRM